MEYELTVFFKAPPKDAVMIQQGVSGLIRDKGFECGTSMKESVEKQPVVISPTASNSDKAEWRL